MIISAFAAVALLAAATTMLPSRSPATSRASRNRGHDVIAELRAATGVNKFPIEEFADRPWSIRPRPGIDAGPAATPSGLISNFAVAWRAPDLLLIEH